MTEEMWLIAAVRLLGALPVLRWVFAGALIAMAVDQSDLFMMNLIQSGGVSDYQTFDKYLDQAYLLAFLAVALRWQGPVRTVAVALYAYRLAGFFAFELTHERDLLLLFPNFFEYWFVLIAGLKYFRLDPFAPEEVVETPGAGLLPYGSATGLPIAVAPQIAVIERAQTKLSSTAFGVMVGGLVALKLFQEYALHYGRWLDGFTAVEAVEAAWRFLTPPY
jgi:hypothetical protein